LLWVTLTVVLSGCLSESASFQRTGGLARIAVAAPFSGESYLTGYRVLFAARLAVREWNEQGGVVGRRIELIALDDESREQTARLQARAFTLDRDLIGVIGHPSPASASAAAPVYSAAGLPALLLGPIDSPPGNGPALGLSPSLESLGRSVATLASGMTAPAPKRLALLWSVNDPRERQAPIALSLMRRQLEEAGLAVALQRGISNRADEAVAAAGEMSGLSIDLVVFLGDADEAAALSRALGTLPKPPKLLLAPWTVEPRFLQLAGGSAETVFYLGTAPDPADFAPASDFYTAYRNLALAAALELEPGPEGLLAYVAANLLLQAAHDAWQANPRHNREEIAAALRRPEGFATLLGVLAFDDQARRTPLPLYLFQITRLRYGGPPLTVATVVP